MIEGATLRAYAESDASEVAACLTSGAELDTTLLPLSEDEWRGFAGRPFNNGARDFMVAERDRAIVGVLISTRNERNGEPLRSFRIIVHPDARRRGIATRMLALVEGQDSDGDTILCAELPGRWKVGAGMLSRNGFQIVERLLWMRADDAPPEVAPPDGFRLRPYREADDAAWRRLNREAYEGTSDYTDLIAAEREAIRKESQFHLWVAERGGEVVGMCHTKAFSGKGYINSLVVTAACRSHGVGRELLVAGMRTLREQARRPVHLNVRAENEPAVALYRSAGFIVDDDLNEWRKLRG